MSADVKVPRLAESISEAVLVEWLKPEGAEVRTDEAIVTLETDKAAVEIAAPEAGVLHQLRKPGERVVVDDVIARIEASAGAPAQTGGNGAQSAPAASGPGPAAAAAPAEGREEGALSPAVRRLVEEHGIDPSRIPATGKGGRLLKEDVLRYLESLSPASVGSPSQTAGAASTVASGQGVGAPTAAAPEPALTVAAPPPPAPVPPASPPGAAAAPVAPVPAPGAAPVSSPPAPARPAASPPPRPPAAVTAVEDERIVPMSRIRQRIAERLVRAQHTAAILTTFNEIDMSGVLELRARHRESFERRHGVRLGFMSFFARASVLALEEVPEINAEIRGTDVVYRRRVHLGVAVGTDRGLVVPVVRDAHRLGFGAIEREIARLADRAREGTLTLEELSGGTFTISNGGVYGSLLSTPILNPPQSGILGMHKIEKRPVAIDDAVAIRPMMYVALSYDHRLVDGEQAVSFLVRVKERLEDPGRMLLDV